MQPHPSGRFHHAGADPGKTQPQRIDPRRPERRLSMMLAEKSEQASCRRLLARPVHNKSGIVASYIAADGYTGRPLLEKRFQPMMIPLHISWSNRNKDDLPLRCNSTVTDRQTVKTRILG